MEVSNPSIVTDHIVDFGEQSFLKLPILNYMKLMDMEPNTPQTAFINAINDPNHRFITAALSRRTGKSLISNIIGQLVTLVPGSAVLIIAPNYALSQISWDLQRGLLNRFEIELTKSNAKDKIMELKNGSTIRMGSVSQADSVVGRSYDLIIFDEAALDSRGVDVFNIQLRPTLDKVNSKAIFISTPRGKNYFYEFWKRGYNDEFDSWVSIRSTWHDNPRVDIKDIEEARRSMSKAEFEQEYECNFVSLQGQVWNFDVKTMVTNIDQDQIDVYDVISGLDLGFRDPTAFCVILTDGEKFYVVDEYLENGRTTADYAGKIGTLIDEYEVDFTYIDSAAQQTRFDFAQNYDISTINAKKSILDGIGYVGSIIDNGRLIVDSKCKNVIAALVNYQWDNREGLAGERTLHNDYSHMAAPIRYALYNPSQH